MKDLSQPMTTTWHVVYDAEGIALLQGSAGVIPPAPKLKNGMGKNNTGFAEASVINSV